MYLRPGRNTTSRPEEPPMSFDIDPGTLSRIQSLYGDARAQG